jgi:hypothetical protein
MKHLNIAGRLRDTRNLGGRCSSSLDVFTPDGLDAESNGGLFGVVRYIRMCPDPFENLVRSVDQFVDLVLGTQGHVGAVGE